MRRLAVLLTAVFLLLAGPAGAQDDQDYQAARQAEADNNFETVMQSNDWAQLQSGGRPAPSPPPSATGEVVLPLARWEALRSRLAQISATQVAPETPLVVLGASRFRGRAADGALALTLELSVSLAGEGLYKTVPLVGDEVVVVQARVAGSTDPLPLSSRNGYHVWITRDSGEINLELELLVPSRGRRGSLEYDFLIARTPVTQFACHFPASGLEPRLRSAVRAQVRPQGGGTQLEASLEPTSRIHLVGFRDVGPQQDRQARIYAESLNLLSVQEGALDLFTVLRYDILHAGVKEFAVWLPPGMTVISADGEGAFRYSLEPAEEGSLLRGETAFPIRDDYEISLRLRRQMDDSGEPFELLLPRSPGVEREYGWLGVEVTGNLKLEELERHQVLAVDVRQLPWEMAQSAVSPILMAYRFHAAEPRLRISAASLPEMEAATGSADRVEATTTVSAEGTVLTDLRISLRNRLRHSLTMQLPPGMEARSAHLDGRPVKPARDARGRLVLPLQRSLGTSQLESFTLQLVLQSERTALGLAGAPQLALPALELPVSALQWRVFLPAKNIYSALRGDIEPQRYAGAGSWHQTAAPVTIAASDQAASPMAPPASAGTGAMPVRIDLPQTGTQLQYARYWLEPEQPVQVSFWYLRGWLRGPLALLLMALAALGALQAGRGWGRGLRAAQLWLALAGTALCCWPLLKLGGLAAALCALGLGLAVHAWQRGVLGRSWQLGRSWLKRRAGEDAEPTLWSRRRVESRAGLVLVGALLGLVSGLSLLRVLLALV